MFIKPRTVMFLLLPLLLSSCNNPVIPQKDSSFGFSSSSSRNSSNDKLSNSLSKPYSFFSYSWGYGPSKGIEVFLQSIETGAILKQGKIATNFENDSVGGAMAVQYNSATDTIIFRANNYAGEEVDAPINSNVDFCSALEQTDFHGSKPKVILSNNVCSPYDNLNSWIVHPRLPFLFALTRDGQKSPFAWYITKVDLRNPEKQERFGPLPVDSFAVSRPMLLGLTPDGNNLFAYEMIPRRDGEANSWMWRIHSLDIQSKRLTERESDFAAQHEIPKDLPADWGTPPLGTVSPDGRLMAKAFSVLDLASGTSTIMAGTEMYSSKDIVAHWSDDSKLVRLSTTRIRESGDETKLLAIYDIEAKQLKLLPLTMCLTFDFLPGTHMVVDAGCSGNFHGYDLYDVDTQNWIHNESNRGIPQSIFAPSNPL